MSRHYIDRRTVLRGAGGVTIALPGLEIMRRPGRAAAAAPPNRFVVCYAGMSIGAYDAPWDRVTPKVTGLDYELTRGLTSLGGGKDYSSVKSDVGVVSGLTIPWGKTPPPGGRIFTFHGTTRIPQLTGKPNNPPPGVQADLEVPNGAPTVDHLVAERIAGSTPHPSVQLRVQAIEYLFSGFQSYMSWGRNGQPVEPIASPRVLYKTLFGDGTSVGAGSMPALDTVLARRRSVIDLVRVNTQELMKRLGNEDRVRMQRHFDEIRALEDRVGAIAQPTAPVCKSPPPLTDDPPVGTGSNYMNDVFVSGGGSNEDLRAQLIFDFLALAMACDLTRVASVMLTWTGSHMPFAVVSPGGPRADLHGSSHGEGGATNGDMADAVAWHVKHVARFIARLRDTRDSDGSSLLDHSAIVMLFEGGHGRDPDGDAGDTQYNAGWHWAHSSENMIALVAGRAGGLTPGRHVRFNNDRHPAQVVLSAMNAVGAPGPLGDVTSTLPELFNA